MLQRFAVRFVFLCATVFFMACATESMADFKDVSIDEVAKMIETQKVGTDIIVLDVRTPKEFGESHIPGAINIDVVPDGFAERIAGFDKDKTYIVHCRAGVRGKKALDIMQQEGFTTVYHMAEGFLPWSEKGFPMEQ